MAIAPIQGMLRRRMMLDLGIGIGGGITAGYSYWYGIHRPMVKNRDDWYAAQQAAAKA